MVINCETLMTFCLCFQPPFGRASLWEQSWIPLCTATWEGGLHNLQEPGEACRTVESWFISQWCSFIKLYEFSQMGETHEKTKESSEYLKYLTQQAVALQRTMNEIYKNGSNASIMPLKVTWSWHSWLCLFHDYQLAMILNFLSFLSFPSSLLPAWPVS